MHFGSTYSSLSLTRTSGLRLACAGAFLLALTANLRQASAGFFQFSTTVTILSGWVPPGSSVGPTGVTDPLTTPGGTVITLKGAASNSPFDNVDGSGTGSDIVFGNMSVAIAHDAPLETIVIPYSFHVVIDDFAAYNSIAVLDSRTFDIAGSIVGTLSPDTVGPGKKVNLSFNSFNSTTLIKTFTLANEVYTMTAFSYVPPGPTNEGAFGVHVTAVQQLPVPEPGTATLLGLGLLALVFPAVRRRRRKA